MARLTRLTSEQINRAASRARRGASPHGAPVDEGVPRRTVLYWLQRGRGEHPTAAPISPYVDLMQALEIAEAIRHGELRTPACIEGGAADFWQCSCDSRRTTVLWTRLSPGGYSGERHCGG